MPNAADGIEASDRLPSTDTLAVAAAEAGVALIGTRPAAVSPTAPANTRRKGRRDGHSDLSRRTGTPVMGTWSALPSGDRHSAWTIRSDRRFFARSADNIRRRGEACNRRALPRHFHFLSCAAWTLPAPERRVRWTQ